MAQEAAVLSGPELSLPCRGVPYRDRPLKRARLRPVRRRAAAGRGAVMKQVVATLWLAWTLGIVAATASLVGNGQPSPPSLASASQPEASAGQDI